VCGHSPNVKAASLVPQQRGELHQEFLGFTPVAIRLSLFELQHLLLFKECAFCGLSHPPCVAGGWQSGLRAHQAATSCLGPAWIKHWPAFP
jgi:hypothetical protein